MNDLTMKSLFEVSELIKGKKVSPIELVDENLKKIKEHIKYNAYITILEEEAQKQAKVAESQLMKGIISPLHGIPYALKDTFHTKGILTSYGSGAFSDHIPIKSSPIYEKLQNAGGILLGKTNTHEFAYGPTGEDSYYGAIHNPWNFDYIAGGSSGGSATAVGLGLAYMAMGTDTGGSIRIPASFSGVVGFKPTYKTVSIEETFALTLNLDHAGPLARSVMDIAITMDYISEDDINNCGLQGMNKKKPPFYAEDISNADNLKGMIIGIPEESYFDIIDYEVERAFRESIKKFEELGAIIKTIKMPGEERSRDSCRIIIDTEASYLYIETINKLGNKISPRVKQKIKDGKDNLALDYIKALKDREKSIEDWDNALKEMDAVVCPATPFTAFPINQETINNRGVSIDPRKLSSMLALSANITGAPVLSIPCGFASNNMPIGMQIMGARYDDVTVLKIGYAFEKHNPFTLCLKQSDT